MRSRHIRRRLSSVELMPIEAAPLLQRAYDALLDRRAPQNVIHAELCRELEAIKLQTISASAFSRWTKAVVRGEVGRPGSTAKTDAANGLASAFAKVEAAVAELRRQINTIEETT